MASEFVVEEVDAGWIVRLGPDVLITTASEVDALLAAQQHVRAVQAKGGQASVEVVRRPA